MTDICNLKTGLSRGKFDDDTLMQCRDSGIEKIEVSPSRNEILYLNFPKIRKKIEEYGMTVHSLHLPFGGGVLDISETNEAVRNLTVTIDCFLIEKANVLGAKYVIVHPSAEPIEECDRPARIEACKKSLKVLCDEADKYGITVAVENLPRTCLCRTSDEMREILDSDSRLVWCFDVNHLLSESHESYIKVCGDRLATTHISDYDFNDEQHAFPGVGYIDWKRLAELFEGVGYEGVWMHEVDLNGSDGKKRGFPFDARPISDVKKCHLGLKSFTGEGKRL